MVGAKCCRLVHELAPELCLDVQSHIRPMLGIRIRDVSDWFVGCPVVAVVELEHCFAGDVPSCARLSCVRCWHCKVRSLSISFVVPEHFSIIRTTTAP